MDKTDAALAAILDKLGNATEAMSGPAYQMLLATARARAFTDMVEVVMALVVLAIVGSVFCVAVRKCKETDFDSPWVPGLMLSGVGCIVCIIWLAVMIAELPWNYMAYNHPEIAIGRMILDRAEPRN